ncbi:MAG: endonuclease [Bacteroidota bacterium]
MILLALLCFYGTAQTIRPLQESAVISTVDYYESAYKLYGTALRTALHNIIKGHTVVSYASLWTHMQTTDKKPNGKVWDMYSDVPGGTLPYEFTFSTDQCGLYSVEGDCYNREHSWPKSWFNDVSPPYSDLFHLFPTDGKVNGIRSNYPYGNVGVVNTVSLNGSKLGQSIVPGYSKTVFEPIDAYKGDLARAQMYMSVRYYLEDGTWSFSDATNKSDLVSWYAGLLYSWHIKDSVSTKEINRNQAVYGIQKNRNPFIDHPEFAAEIWQTGMAPALVSISSPTVTTVILDFSRYLDSTAAVTKENFIIDHSVGTAAEVTWGVNGDISQIMVTTSPLKPETTYTLQIKNLKSINNVPMPETSITFKTSGITAAPSSQSVPHSFILEQNFPNPFNPSTEIRFTLPVSGFITLRIFTVLGQEVKVLLDGKQEAGSHRVHFAADDLPSGLYFYSLQSGSNVQTKKMTFLK